MPLPRPVDWSEIENDPQWNQLDPTQRRTVFANWQNHVRGFVDENGGFNDQTAATFHNDLAQITERNGLLEPEGPLTTAARKFASTILPDTATAAGGLGAGALAIESGPGTNSTGTELQRVKSINQNLNTVEVPPNNDLQAEYKASGYRGSIDNYKEMKRQASMSGMDKTKEALVAGAGAVGSVIDFLSGGSKPAPRRLNPAGG